MTHKITDKIKLLLNKHNNPQATAESLKTWTTERRDFFLEKMDWMESSLDKNNHEAYRIAFNQLKAAVKNQKETLDKVHDLLIFDDSDK